MPHRHPRAAPPASLAAALAAATVLTACILDGPTAVDRRSRVEIVPQAQLIPTPSDDDALPINRIRAHASRVSDDAVIGRTVVDVNADDPHWTIDLDVQTDIETTVVVFLSLINVAADGSEEVQFSGRTDPITVGPGEAITPAVPITRGPPENLSVTSVTISTPPQQIEVGESVVLAATATTSDGATPEIFWASLDESVVSLDGTTATGESNGTADIVAFAGLRADTVTITVGPADVEPPAVELLVPGQGVLNARRNTAVSATFTEPIDPASVDATSLVLLDSLGAAVAGIVSVAGSDVYFTPDQVLDRSHTYQATVSGVADFAGNALADPVTWSFTTEDGVVILGDASFDAGLGTLVAVAFRDSDSRLLIHDDFNDSIRVYSTAGVDVGPALPRPGLSSNDIDLDVMEGPATMGTTALPTGTLLVHNGEASPASLYAVDPDDGTVLDSLGLTTVANAVGGAFNIHTGTFFQVLWNADTVEEIDMVTGAVLNSFPVAPVGGPAFDVFYGDIEVNPNDGTLILVSSTQNTIRILDTDGTFIDDYDVGGLGITGMSGAAVDWATGTIWIVSTTGMVWETRGIVTPE